MIGDVIARGGRKTLSKLLPTLKKDLSVDFVIAQGENSAGGFGHTLETTHEMIESGVDIITSGNHVWDKKDIMNYIEQAFENRKNITSKAKHKSSSIGFDSFNKNIRDVLNPYITTKKNGTGCIL